MTEWDEEVALLEPAESWDAEIQAMLDVDVESDFSDGALLDPSLIPKPTIPDDIASLLLGPPSMQTVDALMPVFANVLQQSDVHEKFDEPGTDACKLASFYWNEGHHLHTSKEAICKLLDIDRLNIEPLLCVLSNVMVHMDRGNRAKLEEALSTSGYELVLYIDMARYDETPMRVTHKQTMESMLPRSSAGTIDSLGGTDVEMESSHSHLGLSTKASSVSKMLSCEHKHAMLVKTQVADNSGGLATKYVFIMGATLGWNQLLGNASSDCMGRALQETCAVSRHASSFRLKTRLAITDQAPANILCEKLLVEARNDQWCSLHIYCTVHHAARSMTRSFILLEEHVSGLVNFALALSLGPSMVGFRQAVAAIIAHRPMLIHRGHAPPDVVEYQKCMLDTFCKSGSRQKERRLLLEHLATGDWRRGDVIEVYVVEGVDIDSKQVLSTYINGIIYALCHKAFSTYPRHRWLGCDVSTDEVGLLEAVHSLASASFRHWCRCLQLHKDPSQVVPHVLNSKEADLGDPEQSLSEHMVDVVVDSDEDSLAEGECPTLPTKFSAEVNVLSELAKGNAKKRKKVLEWFAMDPFPSLFMLRLCMTPFCSLLETYICRAGDKWKQEQNVKVLKHLIASGDLEGCLRKTPLLDYVALVAEDRFMLDIQDLAASEKWRHMPQKVWDLSHTSLAFRLLSRMCCLVFELIICPTFTCPLALFKLLLNKSHAAHLQKQQFDCQVQGFAKEFLSMYGNNLAGPDALAVLEAISHVACVDTVQLEHGHGQVARTIQSRSQQTHTPSVNFVNALWVAQKVSRRRQQSLNHGRFVKQKIMKRPAQTALEQPQVERQRKKRGGGAYRAFLSLKYRGSKGGVHFGNIKAEYHEEKASNSRVYQEAVRLGKVATERVREEGKPGFGPHMRNLRRHGQSKSARSWAEPERNFALGAPKAIASASENKVVLVQDVPLQLRRLRAVSRQETKDKNSRQAKDDEMVAGFYSTGMGMELLDQTVLDVPELQSFKSGLSVIPNLGIQLLHYDGLSTEAGTQIGDWVVRHSKSSNVKSVLLQDWEQKNRVLLEMGLGMDRQLPAVPRQCTDPQCPSCGLDSRRAKALKAMFLRMLKEQFPRSEPEKRQKLANGMVVFRLDLLEARQGASEWDDAVVDLLDDGSDRPQAKLQGAQWFQIGLQYFTPYRPTMQKLMYVKEMGLGRHELGQTFDFYTDLQLFKSIDVFATPSVQFYEMVCTSAPVEAFNPSLCEVEETSQVLVLQVKRAQPKKRQTQTKTSTSASGGIEELQDTSASALDGQDLQEDVGINDVDDDDDELAEEHSVSDEQDDEMQDKFLGFDDVLAELVGNEQEDQPEGTDMQMEVDAGLDSGDKTNPPTPEPLCEDAWDMQSSDGGFDADSETSLPLAHIFEEQPQPNIAIPPVAEPVQEPIEQHIVDPPLALGALVGGRVPLPAEAVVYIHGGVLTFYATSGVFHARCGVPGHGRCILTRSGQPGRKPEQGRPCGFLCAWLQCGHKHSTKAGHWQKHLWPSREQRLEARAQLESTAAGLELLQHERPLGVGEPEEPIECP
eukprot:6490393-Amphidinium_carterae.1